MTDTKKASVANDETRKVSTEKEGPRASAVAPPPAKVQPEPEQESMAAPPKVHSEKEFVAFLWDLQAFAFPRLGISVLDCPLETPLLGNTPAATTLLADIKVLGCVMSNVWNYCNTSIISPQAKHPWAVLIPHAMRIVCDEQRLRDQPAMVHGLNRVRQSMLAVPADSL